MILTVISNCGDVSLASLLIIVKRIMTLIQIIVPLLLIISVIIGFYQLMADPEDKKQPKKVLNKFIAAVVIFFIPVFMNLVMSIVGQGSNFSSCWMDAEELMSPSVGYMPIDDEREKKKFINDGEYEPGVVNNSNNSNNTNDKTGNNTSTPAVRANRVVFLGDSRTVQLYSRVTGTYGKGIYSSGKVYDLGSDVYIAMSGQGLSWMKKSAIPSIRNYLTSGTSLVILMGVNDLFKLNSYISYINKNAPSWTSNGAKVYFVSVNPCSGNYNRMNPRINSFNSKMRSSLNPIVGYIDTHSYLMSTGYSTYDGLHYNKDTYLKIYKYIKSHV